MTRFQGIGIRFEIGDLIGIGRREEEEEFGEMFVSSVLAFILLSWQFRYALVDSSYGCKFYAVVCEFLRVSRLHINWLAPPAENLTIVFRRLWRCNFFSPLSFPLSLPLRGRFLLLEITKFLIGFAILGGVDDNCLSFTFSSIYYSISLLVGELIKEEILS